MSLKTTRFSEMLFKANDMDPHDFQAWVFCQGMQFNSRDKWWGDHGQRDFPHEGIDICLYRNRAGEIQRLTSQTRVPVMHDGVVKALFKDYLGLAVIIEHEDGQCGDGTCMSVYAHTRPLDEIQAGAMVKAGDIIATIADTRHSKAGIRAHLHFSIGRPSPDFIYEPFVWNNMRDPGQIILLDPLKTLDRPHQILDADDRHCLQARTAPAM